MNSQRTLALGAMWLIAVIGCALALFGGRHGITPPAPHVDMRSRGMAARRIGALAPFRRTTDTDGTANARASSVRPAPARLTSLPGTKPMRLEYERYRYLAAPVSTPCITCGRAVVLQRLGDERECHEWFYRLESSPFSDTELVIERERRP